MIVIFFSEKSGERKVEYIINNKKINDITSVPLKLGRIKN